MEVVIGVKHDFSGSSFGSTPEWNATFNDMVFGEAMEQLLDLVVENVLEHDSSDFDALFVGLVLENGSHLLHDFQSWFQHSWLVLQFFICFFDVVLWVLHVLLKLARSS